MIAYLRDFVNRILLMETIVANEELEVDEKDEVHTSSPWLDSTVHYSICGKAVRRQIIQPRVRLPY